MSEKMIHWREKTDNTGEGDHWSPDLKQVRSGPGLSQMKRERKRERARGDIYFKALAHRTVEVG